MKNLGLIIAISSLSVAIISIPIMLFFALPNPTLEITKIWSGEPKASDIDFYLSNPQTGIVLVDKIELDVKNFEIIEGCSGTGGGFLRPYKFMTQPINLEPNPRIYTIDYLLDTDREKWFPTTDGLKYGGGDIDQFTITYNAPQNSVNYTYGYSFDFLIRTEWHDPSKSNDKRTVESPIQNVQRLGYCDNLDGNLVFP